MPGFDLHFNVQRIGPKRLVGERYIATVQIGNLPMMASDPKDSPDTAVLELVALLS